MRAAPPRTKPWKMVEEIPADSSPALAIMPLAMKVPEKPIRAHDDLQFSGRIDLQRPMDFKTTVPRCWHSCAACRSVSSLPATPDPNQPRSWKLQVMSVCIALYIAWPEWCCDHLKMAAALLVRPREARKAVIKEPGDRTALNMRMM